jgi:uncharacterized membrane protein
MGVRLNRLQAYILRHENKLIWLGIIACASLISALTAVKYGHFGYNGIDLAYFNQVFWNTIHGRPFEQSIHPHLSLGDHAELAILPLSLLYRLFPDPRALLALQALALSLAAWPLFLIAKARLERHPAPSARFIPLAVAVLWLMNPLVWSVAFFEFHILPFAVPALLFALLAYERRRKFAFVIWATLAMLCREDVALAVAFVGMLAIAERRSRWWRITPVVFGFAWFAAAMKLIGHYAEDGGYKFSVYYSWLGNSPSDMVLNAILHPLRVLGHVMTLANAEMLIGLFLALAFVPLLRPWRLLLAIPPLAQILLGAPGGGELILQTHYVSLFLPAIFLAFIEALPAVPALLRKKFPLDHRESLAATALLVAFSAAYGAAVLGPLPHAVNAALNPGNLAARAVLAREALASIPPDAPVAASYSLLPHLSSRENLYSLHYLFLGVTQFGASPYAVPDGLRYEALDLDDLLTYRSTFPATAWAAPRYADGRERLTAALGIPVHYRGPFVIYEKDGEAVTVEESSVEIDAPMGAATLERAGAKLSGRDVAISAEWRVATEDADRYDVRVKLKNAEGIVRAESVISLTALPPASRRTDSDRWRTLAIIPTDGLPDGEYLPEISLETTAYRLVVGGDRGTTLVPKGAPVIEGSHALPAVTVGARR